MNPAIFVLNMSKQKDTQQTAVAEMPEPKLPVQDIFGETNIEIYGAREHNLKNIDAHNSAQQAGSNYRH